MWFGAELMPPFPAVCHPAMIGDGLAGCLGQDAVEFKHLNRILQLEAAGQNGEPLRNLGLCLPLRLGKAADSSAL
jgi:hypothetical protein